MKKRTIKELVIGGLIIAAGIAGYKNGAEKESKKLEAAQKEWFLKEKNYQKKIDSMARKVTETAPFRFYDVNADGISNKLLDSLNNRKYRAPKKHDFTQYELHGVSEAELKGIDAYKISHKKQSKQLAMMNLQFENEGRTACDSAGFAINRNYRHLLVKEMAFVNAAVKGGNEYLLKFSNQNLEWVAQTLIEKINKGKCQNEMDEFRSVAKISFIANLMEVRRVNAVNNELVEQAMQNQDKTALETRKIFDYQQRLRRQALNDSLVVARRENALNKILPKWGEMSKFVGRLGR